MTEKTVLLSRIEQIIRLSKLKVDYQAPAQAKVKKLINSFVTGFGDPETRPVLRIGSKGKPQVLVNISDDATTVMPQWRLLSSHLKKNDVLLSENWYKNNPEAKISFGSKQTKPFEKLTRESDIISALKRFKEGLKAAIENKNAFNPDLFINT